MHLAGPLRLVGVGAVVCALAATGLVAAGEGAPGPQDKPAANVVASAREQLGDAYRYGGNGPAEWDCSGLTWTLWRSVGNVTDIPRVSRDQQRWAWPLRAEDARPGDLVFWGDPVTHVGIYVGGGRVIDASSGRKQVVERAIWTSDVVRYGRVPRKGVAKPPAPVPASSSPAPAPAASGTPSAAPKPSQSAKPSPSAKPSQSTKPRPSAKPSPSAKPAPKPTASTKPGPKPSGSASPAGHRPIPPAGHKAVTSPWANQLVAAATRQLGAGWQAKGRGPRFDAAGLLGWAVGQVDKRTLPDTPAAIERLTRPVALKDLQVGDLVFYGSPAVHVAIYAGNGEMIDASKVLEKVTRRRVFSSETVRFARLPR